MEDAVAHPSLKRCPACEAFVLGYAHVCLYCGYDFATGRSPSGPARWPRTGPDGYALYGRWKVGSTSGSFPADTAVTLATKGATLRCRSEDFVLLLDTGDASVTQALGRLVIRPRRHPAMWLVPLDGQDPGFVSSEIQAAASTV